jgi:CHAD domain-containing protein
MNASSHTLFTTFARVLNGMDSLAPAKEIHKLRTTARRIEALTAYLPDKVRRKDEEVIAEIKAVRKRSGKVRDLDVQLELLEKMGDGTQPQQFAVLQDQLRQRRDRRAQKLFKEVRLLRRKKWLNRLERLAQDVTKAGPKKLKKNEPLLAAKEQLHILAARYPDSVSMVDPEELHRLRIELKKIRYTAELSGGDAATKRFTAALEKTQDAIGDWHDWLTLSESAEEALNNYVSSGVLMQLRSLTTSAFSAAIQSVTELLSSETAPAKKSPRGISLRSRARRSA